MSNPTVLEIDSAAITHNLKYFRSKISKSTKLLVVIKAFAYGGDSVAIAKILKQNNVDYLGVTYTQEGMALRKANIKTPILVMHPQPESFENLIAYDLEPNLYNFRSLKAFLAIASQKELKSYPVHIKINSGMNRLGFNENDLPLLTPVLSDLKNLKIKSYFSHLAASEDPNEKKFTLQQISNFHKITHSLNNILRYKPWKHISNTSGILHYPEAHFDMVRLGIGFYGFGNNPAVTASLKNVYNLKTKLSQIQFLKKGETAGYNRKYVAKEDTKIGILPLGYADGLSRSLGNKVGSVYLKNKKVPIIGNICMGMTIIDLGGIDCKEGDEVVIFNHQDHVLALAKINATISYEILSSISQRVQRQII